MGAKDSATEAGASLAGDDATREGARAAGEPRAPAPDEQDGAALLRDLAAMDAVRARLTLDRVFAVAEAGLVYVEWMRVLGFAPDCPGTPWATLCRAVDRLKTLQEIRHAEGTI